MPPNDRTFARWPASCSSRGPWTIDPPRSTALRSEPTLPNACRCRLIAACHPIRLHSTRCPRNLNTHGEVDAAHHATQLRVALKSRAFIPWLHHKGLRAGFAAYPVQIRKMTSMLALVTTTILSNSLGTYTRQNQASTSRPPWPDCTVRPATLTCASNLTG